ncbi:MAG TPA: hypothetical protein VNW94_04185 [Streptosporangiaceae bacterium]|jgi:hypothetical protein|nr:hypothetical protein [Streptosporangiaceae bacterium]
MLITTQDNEEIIERVAALDIGKAELVCRVRVPDEDHPGRRLQEVQAYPTLTRSVLRLVDHLARLGVTRVVMEATDVIRGAKGPSRTLPRSCRLPRTFPVLPVGAEILPRTSGLAYAASAAGAAEVASRHLQCSSTRCQISGRYTIPMQPPPPSGYWWPRVSWRPQGMAGNRSHRRGL